MKHLSILLLSLFMLGIGLSGLKSQDLLIRMYDGTEYIKPLNTVQSLTFPAGSLLLTYTNNTTEPYNMSDVRSLHFDTGPLAVENAVLNGNNGMSVFPNPADNLIHILNIPDGINNVKIFNLYGALVLDSQLTSGNKTININCLNPGMYIIEINNRTFKFNKL